MIIGGRVTSLILLTLLLCAGCSARPPAGPTPPDAAGRVRLIGQLVEGGVECLRFRSVDAKFYTLASRDLGGFQIGDTVEIIGRIATVSFCMQDTPIQVETIRAYRP